MHSTRIDIPLKNRELLCELLNARLADAIVMGLNAKHAHWNVKGPLFLTLHEQFDKLAELHQEQADELAERIAALGGTAYGTVASLSQSQLKSYESAALDGISQINAYADKLAQFGKDIRSASTAAGELNDESTADLFTEISRAIDKSLWFIEAHLQADK